VLDNIRVVSFVAEARPFIANSKFAGFVSEPWLMKEKYQE
jgi:hypothetical protein